MRRSGGGNLVLKVYVHTVASVRSIGAGSMLHAPCSMLHAAAAAAAAAEMQKEVNTAGLELFF